MIRLKQLWRLLKTTFKEWSEDKSARLAAALAYYDVKTTWQDVWIGSVMTALLFAIGKFGLGLYLGNSVMGSTYGAAGSIIVLLIWIYYSAQILFFGAEFTQVYAKKYGSKIVPDQHAVPLTAEARAKQGMESQSRW
ncbi:MAG: hypothetical protein HC851_21430 [Acaryochloris sp. RU_4_1]|nr:hypothetical protein [Acaryochloris sp. RU_4_1]